MTVTIREDGAYHFLSMRTIGIMHGQGTFTIADGKLRAETERGWGLGMLYEKGERQMLKVEGATEGWYGYSADLDPAK